MGKANSGNLRAPRPARAGRHRRERHEVGSARAGRRQLRLGGPTGGELSVGPASEREGAAACVSGRTETSHGLRQEALVEPLAAGGPFTFSSWIRVGGAGGQTVNAALTITEEGQALRDLSLATIVAADGRWIELAGNFGLGFNAAPVTIELKLYGPSADVELCAADVKIQPLSAR
ncbi:carbohydrate binding domain-containing protein [Sorangium atrum]|uniref:Carbohydrate binding domain-containing protein n=1 Tax=Sorangium atrum TaxID=2995308 RepID=A0ABT5BZ00_9BACT|nr:carbohydrate binding domain-containing protein [Sorangium aterium]MDC0679381.1 carbohydrate binding domain-containing protein [Sorangium aterium]